MKTVLNEDEISEMVEQIKSMKGLRLADESIYNSRIKICGECDKLEYGSTCMSCGCVMQVRARLADGKCPLKKWGR